MHLRAPAAAVAVLVVLVLDLDADEKPIAFLGTVKEAAEDGASLEVRTAAKKAYAVAIPDDALLSTHEAASIRDLADGTPLHILGKYQKPEKTPEDKEIPARIGQVRAIAAGSRYAPPPLPPDLEKIGVVWHAATLVKRNEAAFLISYQGTDISLQTGPDRLVLVLQPLDRADLARSKAKQLFVEGVELAPEEGAARGAPKPVRAKTVAIVTKKLPADEYRLLLGL